MFLASPRLPVVDAWAQYGKVQSVKIRREGDVLCATVSFIDLRSAVKAHVAENKVEERLLPTDYVELPPGQALFIHDEPPVPPPQQPRGAGPPAAPAIGLSQAVSVAASAPGASPYPPPGAGARNPRSAELGVAPYEDTPRQRRVSASVRFDSRGRIVSRNSAIGAASAASAKTECGGAGYVTLREWAGLMGRSIIGRAGRMAATGTVARRAGAGMTPASVGVLSAPGERRRHAAAIPRDPTAPENRVTRVKVGPRSSLRT
ncbi:hypothetical protein HPB47_001035 [Ixodes persulcatus]|uniref:Uncharacterized protein n=1 Tax=Ixodes persulcatus TaxID=34615 RepID=A0AC60PQ96_IXOPE|nr:hypothetical protein HPB47_001035 [Ixodes persulcatus]